MPVFAPYTILLLASGTIRTRLEVRLGRASSRRAGFRRHDLLFTRAVLGQNNYNKYDEFLQEALTGHFFFASLKAMVRVIDLVPQLIRAELAKELKREPTEKEFEEAMENKKTRLDLLARITPEVERQIPQAKTGSTIKPLSPDTSVSSGETKG